MKLNNAKGASVRPNLEVGPASLRGTRITLLDYVRTAYEDQFFQIRAPDWFHTETFDIEARAGEAVPRSTLMAMLRSLLANRFSLAAHVETKTLTVYALEVGKKLAIRESDPNGVAAWSNSNGALAYNHISMRQFAELLNSTGTILFHLDLPVLDMTGLDGFYDLQLTYPIREFMADRDGTLLFSALRKTGLELVRRKAPVKTLIVDHAERPSEN